MTPPWPWPSTWQEMCIRDSYVTLNVLLMDGTASTLKLTKSDYDSLFKGNSDFETAYAYTMNEMCIRDRARSCSTCPPLPTCWARP